MNLPKIFSQQLNKLSRFKGAFLFVLLTIVILTVIYYAGYFLGPKPENIRIANVGSNSFTISWTTKTPDVGTIYYSSSESFLNVPAPFSLFFSQKAFDDRDVAQYEIEKVTNEKVSLSQGKYYSHSVTVKGLEFSSKYFFKIGNNFFAYGGKNLLTRDAFLSEAAISDELSVVTLPFSNNLRAPDPSFGLVLNQDGSPAKDKIITVHFLNGQQLDVPLTNMLSTITGEEGDYYIDLSNAKSFLTGEDIFLEESGEILQIITIIDERGIRNEQQIPITLNAPVGDIYLSDEYTDGVTSQLSVEQVFANSGPKASYSPETADYISAMLPVQTVYGQGTNDCTNKNCGAGQCWTGDNPNDGGWACRCNNGTMIGPNTSPKTCLDQAPLPPPPSGGPTGNDCTGRSCGSYGTCDPWTNPNDGGWACRCNNGTIMGPDKNIKTCPAPAVAPAPTQAPASCQCSGGTFYGGAAIPPSSTRCGSTQQFCGADRNSYACTAQGWAYVGAGCANAIGAPAPTQIPPVKTPVPTPTPTSQIKVCPTGRALTAQEVPCTCATANMSISAAGTVCPAITATPVVQTSCPANTPINSGPIQFVSKPQASCVSATVNGTSVWCCPAAVVSTPVPTVINDCTGKTCGSYGACITGPNPNDGGWGCQCNNGSTIQPNTHPYKICPAPNTNLGCDGNGGCLGGANGNTCVYNGTVGSIQYAGQACYQCVNGAWGLASDQNKCRVPNPTSCQPNQTLHSGTKPSGYSASRCTGGDQGHTGISESGQQFQYWCCNPLPIACPNNLPRNLGPIDRVPNRPAASCVSTQLSGGTSWCCPPVVATPTPTPTPIVTVVATPTPAPTVATCRHNVVLGNAELPCFCDGTPQGQITTRSQEKVCRHLLGSGFAACGNRDPYGVPMMCQIRTGMNATATHYSATWDGDGIPERRPLNSTYCPPFDYTGSNPLNNDIAHGASTFSLTTERYRCNNGTWERIEGKSFEFYVPATPGSDHLILALIPTSRCDPSIEQRSSTSTSPSCRSVTPSAAEGPGNYYCCPKINPDVPAQPQSSAPSLIATAYAQAEQSNKVVVINDQNVAFLQDGVYRFTLNGKTYVVEVAGATSDSRIYLDENKNNQKDANEKYIDEIQKLSEISIESVTQKYTYTFKPGFNFVAFPFVMQEDMTKASQLLAHLKKSGSFVLVSSYDGGWKTITSADDSANQSSNFAIQPGRGYVIRLLDSEPVSVSFTGFPVRNSATLSLSRGWNLIGVYNSNKTYLATTLISDIMKKNIEAVNVTRFDDALYSGIQVEGTRKYGFDFPIEHDKGYFINIRTLPNANDRALNWSAE